MTRPEALRGLVNLYETSTIRISQGWYPGLQLAGNMSISPPSLSAARAGSAGSSDENGRAA